MRPLTTLLEPAELERVLGGARAELARLVPELAAADQPAGALAPGQLFELLLGALHRLAEGRAVLLVIEDVHWADRSTRDLLGFLIRNVRGGIALVLTYRSDELHRRHPLRPFLVELERSGRAERLDVARLDRAELTDLLGGILGTTPTPGLVEEIWARSEGNPFFAEELVAARSEGMELPEALRDVLLARVETLSEETQAMLQVAAVAGRQVDHELLAEVMGLPAERLTGWMREAITHHTLAVEGGGGYAFRHALVHEAVYDDLLPMQRVPLHAACARALAARAEQPQGRAQAAVLGQLAYHWNAAENVGEALVASVRAGQAAESASAPAEADRHYQRALGLWEQVPDALTRSPLDHRTLLRRAAQVMSLIGEPGGAVKMITRALAETDTATEPLLAGALLERLARYHWLNGDTVQAMTAAERAVATVPAEPPSPERARTLAAHGQLLMLLSRFKDARARCEEAVDAARRVGARAEEGHALNTLGTALGGLGHVEDGIAALRQADRIARELGDPYDLCRAPFNLSDVFLSDGRFEEALAIAMEGADRAVRLGMERGIKWAVLYNAAEALIWLGRWDEADRVLEEAIGIDAETGRMGYIVLAPRAQLRLWRGDLTAARSDVTTALDSAQVLPDPQLVAPTLSTLAGVATWEGRPEEARATVARGLELMAGVSDTRLVLELCVAGLEAEAAIAERATAAHAPETRAEAADVASALLRRAHTATTDDGTVPTRMGRVMVLTAEAHAARVTGRGDPDRWAAAATAWEAVDCPWPAAYARWRQAEALLANGAARVQAGPPLRQAWATASGLGARLLRAEVESLGRRARIDVAPGEPATEPDSASPAPVDAIRRLGLTGREREVLALVADGHTNRQIADVLFISDKTASVHVSRILAKLGVANRAEAAVAAHRLGLSAG
jgi:DNA-binding CsgD family transcriptional regulator/tetratricopeptide (TPR) repeat protein